ncbi:hypothetical protein TL18_04645 [Methanobrevibacter sp. YE315]|uniref:hypothetical protein n=1 Tax=Methanobrevibacter sp. YE315 TaxID=1609968 RepID=UPI000764E549|nr:hypothetical protein [Methanobrevibacter sp. YE315]AMD17369.1 hypothetical protein TL18_04645 [Methanobrevibacter sp. YE315]
MKFINKICIVLIILIFTMGFVASANVHDFKYPDNFKKMDDGDGYINDMGQGMIVYEYDEASKQLFLTNHGLYAFEYYENNYYVFSDNENNLCGLLEVVDYKGDKYIVISTILIDNLESESGYIQDNLEDFNKLNNVKPLTI